MTLRRDEGYVLLEVMMAIVILVCGTLAVTESFRSTLRTNRESRGEYLAALRLEGKLLETEKIGRANLDPETDPDLGPLSWTEATQPAATGDWTVHQLTMSWGQGQGSNQLELPTYLSN